MVARKLLDRLANDFLDENMSGFVWRRALIARISRHSDALLFTIGILALYRIGIYIPVPGVNAESLALLREARDPGMFDLYDLFTGGNLDRVTIFALGITPYITASIFVQAVAFVWRLLTPDKNGRDRRWSIRVTGVATLLLCVMQASSIALFLQRMSDEPGGPPLVYHPGWTFRLITVLTLTTGTACFMWLSDYITRRGIANGMFLIFVAGIIAGLPGDLDALRAQPFRVLMSLALALAVVAVTARGYRRALERA